MHDLSDNVAGNTWDTPGCVCVYVQASVCIICSERIRCDFSGIEQ